MGEEIKTIEENSEAFLERKQRLIAQQEYDRILIEEIILELISDLK